RFFSSSRRRHTRWPRDWSSDVCSSDLLSDAWNERGVWGALPFPETNAPQRAAARKALELDDRLSAAHTSWGNVKATRDWDWASRSEERRVGKEGRSRARGWTKMRREED